MSVIIGSAYGKVIIDASGAIKGTREAKGSVDSFAASLKSGDATMKSFTAQLLASGKNAGLSANQMAKMAAATGQFTDRQVLAARASSAVAAKADELTRAVANGTMTTREAGAAFKTFAESQVVAAGKTQGLIDTFNTAIKVIGLATGILIAAGAAAKKAFDLGEEGAQVTQLNKSFAVLLKTVGAAPDLLDQLRKASGGTIDDMTLMASTAKLLAGTTGDLSKEMAAAAPRLVEIARAAVKLDPTIGSVSYVFESLARGIKKNQPLLIDNANISLRVGDANEKMAAQLGKSVNDLTNEEKSLALLFETLRGGDEIIRQVGGTAASEADNYARLSAEMKNWSDLGKQVVGGVLDPIVKKLADHFQLENALVRAMRAGNLTYSEALTIRQRYRTGMYDLEEAIEAVSAAEIKGQAAGMGQLRQFEQQQQAAEKLTVSLYKAANGWQELGRSTADMAYEENRDAAQAVIDKNREIAASQRELAIQAAGLAAGLAGELTRTWDDYRETIGDLKKKHEDLTAELGKTEQAELRMAAAGNFVGTVLSGAAQGPYAEFRKANERVISDHQELERQLRRAKEQYGENSEAVADLTDKLAANERQLQLAASHQDLSQQLAALEKKYGPNSKAVQDLTAKILENEAAQRAAAEAAAEHTRQMIYQQAAAGLDTQAALDLARNMGLVSEADYAVASSLETLRQQHDRNKDGTIAAAEGAAEYAAQVEAIASAVVSLQNKGLPVTLDNIKGEMTRLAGQAAPAAGGIDDVAGAAAEAIDPLTRMGERADDAAQAIGNIPPSFSRTYRFNFVTTGEIPFGGRGTGGDPYGAGHAGVEEAGVGRAAGGTVIKGSRYRWNEPGYQGEVLVPAGSGYVLNAGMARQALAMAAASSASQSILQPAPKPAADSGTSQIIDISETNTYYVTDKKAAATLFALREGARRDRLAAFVGR